MGDLAILLMCAVFAGSRSPLVETAVSSDRVTPISRALRIGWGLTSNVTAPIDDATVVDFSVVVVLDVDVVGEGTTTPDLGRVISPIGLMIVGPTGVLRGKKMMPAMPAATSTNEMTVQKIRNGRRMVEGLVALTDVEPRSNPFST
jgi:hypothetical protein